MVVLGGGFCGTTFWSWTTCKTFLLAFAIATTATIMECKCFCFFAFNVMKTKPRILLGALRLLLLLLVAVWPSSWLKVSFCCRNIPISSKLTVGSIRKLTTLLLIVLWTFCGYCAYVCWRVTGSTIGDDRVVAMEKEVSKISSFWCSTVTSRQEGFSEKIQLANYILAERQK